MFSLMISREGGSDFLLNVGTHLFFEGVGELDFSIIDGLEDILFRYP